MLNVIGVLNCNMFFCRLFGAAVWIIFDAECITAKQYQFIADVS